MILHRLIFENEYGAAVRTLHFMQKPTLTVLEGGVRMVEGMLVQGSNVTLYPGSTMTLVHVVVEAQNAEEAETASTH